MKRKISLLLLIALLTGCLPGFTAGAGQEAAVAEGSLFGGKTDDRIPVTVGFDTSWVTERDANVYDPELAQFCALLCADSYYREKDLAKSRQNRVLFEGFSGEEYTHTSFLSEVGFTEAEHFETGFSQEGQPDPNDGAVFNVGHLTVDNAYDVYAVVVRGAFSVQEWRSAFDPGCQSAAAAEWTGGTNGAHHKGADVAANRVFACLSDFMARTDDPSLPDRILITGHSRGGGIANLLGARFEEDESVTSYTYTFAPMAVTLEADADRYETIFNIFDSNDYFTEALTFGDASFGRYGKDLSVSIADSDELIKAIAEIKGRDDYTCASSDVMEKCRAMFAERFPSRDGLSDTVSVTRVYGTEQQVLEDREACLSAEESLGVSALCRLGDIRSEENGTFSLTLEYSGLTLLQSYAMLLSYGTSAYAPFETLFAEDAAGLALGSFLLENSAGFSGAHLIVNCYALAGSLS